MGRTVLVILIAMLTGCSILVTHASPHIRKGKLECNEEGPILDVIAAAIYGAYAGVK
jgi:hypothetical protein